MTANAEFDTQTKEEINSLMTQISAGSADVIDDMTTCSNCGGTDILVSGGTYVCTGCSYQLGELIDEGGEWKNYNNDTSYNDNPRCTVFMNPFLPQMSYNTFIKSDDTAYTNIFKQVSNWQIPHYEKNLRYRLDEIKYFCRECNLPGNITEFAQQLYVEFVKLQSQNMKKKSSRGDCHIGIIAACISHASKEYELPRSPQDICAQLNITNSDYTNTDNLFFQVMQSSEIINITDNQFIIKASDYINSFCSTLGITNQVTLDEISSIEKKVNKLKILQKNTPQAIACGCIFFISKMRGLDITKSDIDKKCNVSIPTLTKVYEHITSYTKYLI